MEVNIPESIELFPADTQHVRWNQVDEIGYYRGENETGTPRIFTVPMEAVAPNIGKSVQVFYEITPGEAMPPLVSPPYILTFSDLTSSDITPVVCTQPPSSGQLSKQAVEAAGGAEFTQKPWPYFLEGQLVKIIAKVGGVTHYLRGSESKGAAVTAEEVNKKALVAPLSVDVVKALKMNDELSVSSEISFDNGAVYKNNQPIVLTIIA